MCIFISLHTSCTIPACTRDVRSKVFWAIKVKWEVGTVLNVTYLFYWDVIFEDNFRLHICVCSIMAHYIHRFVPSWNIAYMCLFHHETLHICVCSIMDHYSLHICVCSIMEYYIYVFFRSWNIAYVCLFHHGTLH